ncbi:MAG: IS66 family insertion sequence element accessory protein TnpB [Roseomonas sp.]
MASKHRPRRILLRYGFRRRTQSHPRHRWYEGQGLCLFAKRLERGHFPWPVTNSGTVMLSAAQASMLLEGIDWRTPQRTWRPSGI